MTQMHTRTDGLEQSSHSSGRAYGFILGITTLLMVAFMAMHPTVHSHEIAGFVEGAAKGAVFNTTVHATLIGCVCVVLFCMIGVAGRLCMRGMLVRAGLVAYSLGAVGLIAAAMINGVIVPGLANRYAAASAAAVESLTPVMVLCHTANGACDYFGVITWSIATAFWSIAMVRRPRGPRGVGVMGLIVAGLPLIALVAGYLPMDIHGFGGFVLVQSLWYLAIAVQLVRGRL